jgi:phosphoglycolate phosphatase-like HAD superfamily hydrolase
MKLLLFDIDGTLLTTFGAGSNAVCLAAKDLFGLDEDLAGITLAGNTDGGIVREVLAKHGVPASEENINRFTEAYFVRLAENLSQNAGTVLPGIHELLNAVDATASAKGLLTGNIERGARLKLGTLGLSTRFEFGAFSDDSHNRNELGPFAKARAEARYKQAFETEAVYVIGDTPRDIACGKAFGARTVAVATGHYRPDDLAPHKPDFIFEDFSSTADVLKALEL